MSTYKVHTIERLYCKNSMALLASLIRYKYDTKLIVTYGNELFNPPKNEYFKVINISRHKREYKGFINSYRRVKND